MVSTNGFPLLNDPPKDQRPESPCRGRRYRRDGSDHRNRSNVSVGSARGESGSFEKGTDEPVRSRKHKRKEKRNRRFCLPLYLDKEEQHILETTLLSSKLI